MFNVAKDALASKAARSYVNGLVERYGRVTELKIDSRAKTVDLACELFGESEPVSVRVDSYRVVTEAGRKAVEITEVSCSRPWLHRLLEDHLRGRKLDLPGWAAAWL